jgi:4-hydroxyproline epimerase
MCGHGTIGTVTMAIENGLVQPKTPGVLSTSTRRPAWCRRVRQEGEYVEEVRITNVPSFLYAEGLTVDCPGLGAHRRCRLWRQFLRHRRAAGELRDMADYSAGDFIAGARRCAAAQREVQLRPSGESGINRLSTCCGPARHAPGGRRAQRRVLRRQGDRPLALRHRHLGAHGAAGTPRAS